MTTSTALEPLKRLTKDLKTAATTLSDREARYLVDLYYDLQEIRKAAGGQVRAATEASEPHLVIQWVGEQAFSLESQIKRALDAYASSHEVGKWAMSIVGIGPIISAGLLAHIDITKAPTVGHVWRFAGLDPSIKWEKKTKRPWNAQLKVLCWHIGESFVKVQNNENDFYGKLLVKRKQYEIGRNDRNELTEQAVAALTAKRYRRETEAYKHYAKGKLPDAQIHARAKRWAVKLFLSHWHAVAYKAKFGTEPPSPYILSQVGGHAHKIEIPNYPW